MLIQPTMMRVVDYIANYIHDLGVHDVFLLTGGGSMFLTDAIAAHPGLTGVCTHHEQAAAMAAISYARYNNNFGVSVLTTGCGGTNAITGLLGAWQDSTPCMFISGQVKRADTTHNLGIPIRQLGVQELDIIKVVSSMTKYSVMITEPEKIAYHLDKAVFLAKSGRPGPVWIDVPMDVQSALIDETVLERYVPKDEEKKAEIEILPSVLDEYALLLSQSKRPVVVAGQGVRLSGAQEEFLNYIEKQQLPVVSPYLGVGVIPTVHDLFIGRLGSKGDRAGNFCVQNADLVIVFGSRLEVSTVGYNYQNFAREAKIVVIDIDSVEHTKKGVRIDLFINTDIKNFLNKLTQSSSNINRNWWAEKALSWKKKWPICSPEYAKETRGVNLYYFTDRLSALMPDDAVVISDAGSAFYVTSQSIQLKGGQRYITSGAQAEMGYTIPAAVGVSIAKNKGEVIGITGDGSFQLNLQELQTIVHYKLPIKMFIWNNDGYLSMRNTQSRYFGNRLIGADSTSGVSFPSLEKIAFAYGIKYVKVNNSQELDEKIKEVLSSSEAVLCEVICLRDQEIIPSVSSYKKEDGTMVSRPIEDMYPFLSREEFLSEMIVAPIKE